MKTFEQALEEAKRKLEVYDYGNKKDEQKDAFNEGVLWLKQNLHLLDAKDLLRHEKVLNLKYAVDHYSKFLEQNGFGNNTALHRALKPFEDET